MLDKTQIEMRRKSRETGRNFIGVVLLSKNKAKIGLKPYLDGDMIIAKRSFGKPFKRLRAVKHA